MQKPFANNAFQYKNKNMHNFQVLKTILLSSVLVINSDTLTEATFNPVQKKTKKKLSR